ncbi:sulfatase family protein [Flavilitoribacter nigricans]|uniref:Sulfatase n=1 Tax=Flavilitoribacter nigricans (strain ATCC 23147 / DSM 23189 / NBRC 102662 / NCIMB 1420 / SS-2) TaxID=1122177 RepID=A0A2D0NJS5_FLAN2|nr:sulfatase [Flavilitoribacter nigricans]PHN08707.1 sulfatase [Flavilitoribacter nigricans DSM 23189 = NBRC 102662]
MKFSPVLLTIGLVLCLFSCADTEQETASETPSRPNILFIMSDDHAYQAISAYMDHLIQTPNIDRIAKEGMLFSNACVTNSICAPSRAVILTGKHSHLNGKIDNRSPFDTTQVTFPQIFQDAGYQTAMYGKLHFGNNPKGVDDFMILPGQGNYINPRFITAEGDTTIEGYVTDIITDLTIDWLDKKRDPNKPFFMAYLHKAPHRPWWPRPDKFKEFTKKTFPEPASLFDDYSNRGTAAKTAEMNLLYHMQYPHDSKIRPETLEAMGEVKPEVPGFAGGFNGPYGRTNDAQRAQYDPVLDSINQFFQENWPGMTDEEKMKWKYQRYMQDYLGCISSVDDNVGRVLDYLEESGLAENTIVVYTSDQGFYLGEHGWFDKRFIYDESFKTPLMVKWPGVIEAGSTNNEMVQNLDFAPTFLEAAGIDVPTDMQGESLMPLLKGENDSWDRDAVYYHYYEYPAVHMVKRHYGVVTKEYKLAHFYYDVDEWELYDRMKDPQEMNNVYDDPEYADVVAELKDKLAELRVKYKDSAELDQKFIDQYNK